MAAAAKPKTRTSKCPICTSAYTQYSSLDPGCSPECKAEIRRQKERKRLAKEARRELRVAKVNLRTISDWIALTQADVNRYARLRDAGDGCISCDLPATWQGRGIWGRQWHASHYMPAGNNSALRFDYANIHKGCSQCNSHKSGNRGPYRVKLIAKIGQAEVDRLEGLRPLKRWTVEELVAIRKQARADIKALIAAREVA